MKAAVSAASRAGRCSPGRTVGELGIAVRREVMLSAARRTPLEAPLVDVETLVFRVKTLRPQMPLSREKCGVAPFFECLGECEFAERQPVGIGSRQEPCAAAPFFRLVRPVGRDVIGNARSLRIFSRHDARARGRADRAGGVRLREPHSRRGQSVDIRRVVKRAAKTAEVSPAQIVDEKKDDVRGDSAARQKAVCQPQAAAN